MSVATSPTLFTCVQCGEPLTLEWTSGAPHCANCGRRSGDPDGVLDLVSDPDRTEEREYYEREYADVPKLRAGGRSIDELERIWTHPAKPVNRALVGSMEDLRGKRVLLIGNGGSPGELHFLKQEPEQLIFSDLSSAGVRSVRDAFELSAHRDRVVFAALDALNLPLPDNSIDIVYGNAIVHHLPDMDRFLAETVRVLRPGGRAVLMDAAYAPLWQLAKKTVLRPLFTLSHRRYPRSPEDVRDTMQGGFREPQLAAKIRALGAEPTFQRLSLVWYLWRRASLVLFPERYKHLGEHPRIASTLTRLDERLARFRIVREHQIRLIWGLRKL